MRTFVYLGLVIFLVVGLSAQRSNAACSGVMNGLGGQDINCPLPLQSTTLNIVSSPAFTTNFPDNVTIPNPGGIQVGSVFAIITEAGDDTLTVNGIVHSQTSTAIFTSGGNDMVFVGPGADISGDFGVSTSNENDLIRVTGGMISATTLPIGSGFDDDTVEITGGSISSMGPEILNTSAGNDTLRISGGTFGPGTIQTSSQEDLIVVSGGIFAGNEIDAGLDVDTIHITDDIPNLGILNCGGGAGMDSLILSMDVPQGQVATLSAEFMAGGEFNEITVNGITYEWAECENRIPNFNGVVTTISLAPHTATNIIDDTHRVSATVLTDGEPDPGVVVTFRIISGPNQGTM
ncbi:MAG: hypothetical protein AAF462_09205, partial [Thermodesulfobacteriota bacterium]